MHAYHNTRKDTGDRGHNRIFSFFAYAVSSVIFDIIAYSISGQIHGFVLAHSVILLYFPLFVFPYSGDALLSLASGYISGGIAQEELLIMGLTVLAFLLGILTHRHLTVRCNGETED